MRTVLGHDLPNLSSTSRARPMRHRHALYLSEAMTQRLQIMAETHGVAKSKILERALKRYLAHDSGEFAGRPAGRAARVEHTLVSPSRARPRHSHGVDCDIRALLFDDYATAARERARGGAGTWSTPVRSGDRGHRQSPSDRSKPDRAGHGNFGRDTARDDLGRPISGR